MAMMVKSSHYDYLDSHINFYSLYMKMTDKNKIIDDVYKHPIVGYGSIKSTYKEAKSINRKYSN